jgi:hypothetical protein
VKVQHHHKMYKFWFVGGCFGDCLVDLLKSYWDSEDHEYLTELLQNYGIPIRFVGIFQDYRVYILLDTGCTYTGG